MARRRGLACCLLAAALAPAPRVAASPLADPFLGGVAFTGPTQPHPTAFYYNPAALALDPGTHVYVAGTLRLDQLGIDRAPIDLDGAPGGARDPGDVDARLLTPGWFAAVYSDFNGRPVTLGLAAYSAYAEKFLPGEEAVRYHTLGGHYYDTTFTPAVAFRVGGRFLIGFGVSIVPYSLLRLEFARDTALEAGTAGLESACGAGPCGAENPDADQRYVVDVDSNLNIGFNAGVALALRNDWYVGAGYVSPTSSFGRLVVEANGDVEVTESPRDGRQTRTGEARVLYKLPQSLFVGVRGPLLGDYELVALARWHHTGRQDAFDLRMFGGDLAAADTPEWYPRYRGLRSVVGLEAGIEAPERTQVRLGGRLRVESAGVDPERMAPHQMYGLNVGVALGAELRPTDAWAISLGYALVYYPDVTADPSAFDPVARVDCVDHDYALERCAATREGRGIPTAAGTYSRLQHAFSLGMRFDWF